METLSCPRCNDRMVARVEGGLSAHLCPTCGGVFIDQALARRVDASMVAGALHRLATDAARRAPFGGSLGVNRIACPVCRALMELRQHERIQITVDVCPAHGVWFDRGELQRVTDRIAASPYRTSGQTEAVAQPRPAVLELPPLDPNYVMPTPRHTYPDGDRPSWGSASTSGVSAGLSVLEAIGDLLSD